MKHKVHELPVWTIMDIYIYGPAIPDIHIWTRSLNMMNGLHMCLMTSHCDHMMCAHLVCSSRPK